ncbi:expressed unknown protein [Seminavis robusta]|uniref:Uncharacterized protein n=1 Tax=Seminavis robusta TaxID=568900 RepID=A0A9N8F0B0_9STRA|nr:expressed unknown protein [Seminavis robusta]|eukprot:Sro2419_g327060.1 n/a (161) ;mRNA; r:5614-6096
MSSRNSNNNNGNNKRKGRRRSRHEIGVGVNAIHKFDQQQQLQAAQQEEEEQSTSNPFQGLGLPSLEELEKHWKVEKATDGGKDRLMCNKDGGHWKIVVSMEELYDTCVLELKQRESWKSFDEYKKFMMDKYYIEESILDCLLVKNNNNNSDDDTQQQQDN